MAYVPSALLEAGYKVQVELSRGWVGGPTIPFFCDSPWVLSQKVNIDTGSVLYLEGVQGEIAVYQEHRLLFVGKRPWVAIPLIGRGAAELRIRSRGKGGILGGMYLLRKDTLIGWPAEPYPLWIGDSCKVGCRYVAKEFSIAALLSLQDSCIGFSEVPPARVQVALAKYHRRFCLAPSAPLAKSKPYESPLPLPVFVGMLLGIGGAVAFFPGLRTVMLAGLRRPIPTNSLETMIGLALLLGLSGAVLSDWGWVSLFGGVLVGEMLFGLFMEGAIHRYWQSWLSGAWVALIVRFVWVPALPGVLVGLWGIRVVRVSLHMPIFLYLCAAQIFIYFLMTA